MGRDEIASNYRDGDLDPLTGEAEARSDLQAISSEFVIIKRRFEQAKDAISSVVLGIGEVDRQIESIDSEKARLESDRERF
jgi:hypothetical protein